ncbi:hypothetical protein DSO57_1029037 [Entomophthora muscae]|uniref:Uncharacterized protein n=1 Tax=Entomophthora muscae TaxID=34485 RepID=A0ACC2TNJ3_9FUNG|nr:hypothetical protein DSO57_1029037 [Entomophthora muscae]
MKATLGSKIPPSQAMAAAVLAWLRKVSTQDQQMSPKPTTNATPKASKSKVTPPKAKKAKTTPKKQPAKGKAPLKTPTPSPEPE